VLTHIRQERTRTLNINKPDIVVMECSREEVINFSCDIQNIFNSRKRKMKQAIEESANQRRFTCEQKKTVLQNRSTKVTHSP